MVLTICRALLIGGVLLWKVLSSDSTRFIEEGTDFILHCPHFNSSNTTNWSRNGQNLSELIGNLSYHVTNARLNDSGVYTCTQSGLVEDFDVKVGRRPTVHRPVCANSPNTTILCTTRAGNTSNTTVCLKVINVFFNENEVETQCNEGNVTISLDLDEFYHHTFNFITTVTNPFGQRTKLDQFRKLGDKVIPDPPMYVEMYPDDLYSFNASFTVPPSWEFGSNNLKTLMYSYVLTQDNLPPHHSVERKLALPFKIQVQRKPYSLVCLRVRLKYLHSDYWGEYSLPNCQHTTEAAPSTGPLSVAATSMQDTLNPGYRKVTVTWEPPDERNRNGIIYQYSVTLKKETVEMTNNVDNYDALMRVLVNGNVTQCTLSGIPSYQPVNITVKAWTKMGESPGTTYTLDPLPEGKNGSNIIIWVLVGFSCLAIFLLSLRCFFVTRRKLFSEHLPEPIFIHPSKIPTFQSLPPQREVFDSLYQRPTSLQGVSPNHGNSDPSTSHWILLNENRGGNAFTGTDSGISCGTESFSTNHSGRCSELEKNRESSSVAEICTYTGLPNNTNVLQCNESKFHHDEEPDFSGMGSDNVDRCNPVGPPSSYSYSGYKRPPPPRVLGNENWKYVPMNTGRREEMFNEDICKDNCFVEDSVPESDVEFEGYITMKSSIANDNKINGDTMEMLEQKSLSKRQNKDEPQGERIIMNASRSVITLQEALANDEWDLTKFNLKNLVTNSPHAFRSCQNLKQICQGTKNVDKSKKELSSEFTRDRNTSTENGHSSVFTEDHELNSNVELTSSRPASRIERDSGYTSDD